MKSILHCATFVVVFGSVINVFGPATVYGLEPRGQRSGEMPKASWGPDAFECVLPYVSRGGMVTLASASGQDQPVEITVMNAYRYTIVVPKNSSFSFEAPVFKDFFVPIIDGGPISFKSSQPIGVSTVLVDNSVTVECSDTTKRSRLFVGGPTTRVALVNITKAPIKVQIFQDSQQTPVLTLTMAGQERKISFLEELFRVSGTHAYRVVAESDGIGFAVIGRIRRGS